MPITGDLKVFSVSDIIQFLCDSRRSGTLRIGGAKGGCTLVFATGEIVSANYLDGLVRIGQVLVRIGAITKAELAWALAIQEQDPANRKPLVLTLLENHMVEKEAAYNGLKMLIEMTLVEVLSWGSGYFKFEESVVDNPGGWHYYLTMHQEVSLNAAAALLESLRIFDEKRRDGTMDDVLGIVGLDSSHSLVIDTKSFRGHEAARLAGA